MNSGDLGWEASAQAWIASQGTQGDASRREILDPALEPIFFHVAGSRVLDVGCGEGRYCRKLSERGAMVTGIDPTQALIEVARALHPEGDYRVCAAESLPFEDDSFDIVLSYLSLVDIDDDLAAISEMCRVARPGGQVVVVTVSNMASTSDTWVRDGEGNKLYRTVDRYMECFPIELSWKGINIVNWHRPLGRTMGAFLGHGMRLTQFLEPLPDPSSPLYADEVRVPTFQVLTFEAP